MVTFSRHVLKLLNAIGSPLEERFLPATIDPRFIAMGGAHVIVAGVGAAYVWQYKNQARQIILNPI